MSNNHDIQQLRDQLDLLVRDYMQANYCGSTSATDAVALDLLKKLRETERMLATLEAELAQMDKAVIKAADCDDAELVMEPVYQAALARQSAREELRRKEGKP